MAVALLGKSIGLLALVVLLYTCCYAFKIREHGGQTVSPTIETQQRGTCSSIFGRCTEKTTTTTSTSTRKWHETVVPRAASSRKPPVEVTSHHDHAKTDGRNLRTKFQRTGYPTADGPTATTKTSRIRNFEVDDDDDEEEVLIEVEDDSADEDEEMLGEQDSDGDDDESDDQEDDVDGNIDDDDDGDEEDEDHEQVEEIQERGAKKDVRKKVEKGSLSVKKSALDKNVDEDKSEREKETEKVVAEKSLGQAVKRVASSKKEEKDEKSDEDSADDEDEDEDDDESADDGDDEDDVDDEESKEKIVPTPQPRKLEKVRRADKDKSKSAEVLSPVLEKRKVEAKGPSETSMKQKEPVKKPSEATRKPVESVKKSTESGGKIVANTEKSVESVKKVESSKITKAEPEKSKSKPTVKSEEKTKSPPVKPEGAKVLPKTKEPVKQSEKTNVKTVNVKSAPTKPTQVSRSDKKESKPKTKQGVEAPISLTELNVAILHVPTFVPNFTAVEDLECQQHGKIFLRQLRGFKMWALQMLDSSAKIPSSLLRGNVNQLGDFDQCLGVMAHVKVDDKTIKVQGKYCLASIDLHASHPDMKFPVNLLQSRSFIRATMRDPGHFVPKFTTVNWALCLPAACSAEDAKNVLEEALSEYNATTGIRFTVDVDPDMCYVRQKSRSYSKETIGVLYFYAMIACLVIVATLRDCIVVSQGKGNYSERIIMSFSLRRTVKALLKEGSHKSDITCIHGIRTLVTIALYVAHNIIPIGRLPLFNRVYFTEVANNPISSMLRGSMVYTDAFLLLSGVLTAFNMANEFTIRGEIRWFCRFIARYIRLTPALLVIVFWYAFVMEHIGSGPQWNSVIVANAELCKNNAWTNLLYIQNFFEFEEMCATHTHQLALDMQLSLIAPALVFFLQCKPIIGILLISFFVLLSATLRYMATMSNYLSLVIFHGMSLKHLYKTANLSYALPLHRATPYVFGVGLGVLLHYSGRNVRIHKVLVILGWLIAMALGSWSLFSPWHLARRDYVYDAEEATHYAVISPVVWALALCWTIFACFTNNGGVINRFLSNYWLVIFSRISYAVYLTQFAVFFHNVGTTRYPAEFQVYKAIDPLQVATVVAASIVLTLFFDLPMQEIKNVIMESTDSLTGEVPSEEKSIEEDKGEVEKLVKAEEIQDKVLNKEERGPPRQDGTRNIIEGGAKSGIDSLEAEAQINLPILKKSEGGRKSFIAHDSYEDEAVTTRNWIKGPNKRLPRDNDDYVERGRRSRNGQRNYPHNSEEEDGDEEDSEISRAHQEELLRRGRRSHSRSLDNKRLPTRASEDEEEYPRRREDEAELRKYRRSESRGRSVIREPDDYRSWEFIGKERASSRGPDTKRISVKSEEYESVPRQTRSSLSRSVDARRTASSESEEEPTSQRKEHLPAEPRISDDEDWENELRIRRKQFMEKFPMQERESLDADEEEVLSSLKRRSSAEGRIALLKDPSGEDNMDSWTVSVGPRMAQLGSSQEPSEPEEDNVYLRRREYRERAPSPRDDIQSEEESSTFDSSRRRSQTSGSQITSVEEDEDSSSFNFVLTKDSKRISLQDLSRLSQEDSDLADSGWNVVKQESADGAPKSTSLGLFKRESIVKSQASEEDPEYLLPERPKLVQQEREHPFKKAWHMQKSRSEEDGSAAYAIKESKEQQVEIKSKDEDSGSIIKRELSGEQSEDVGSLADDEGESTTLSRSRSSDTEETRTSSKSEETESASTGRSQSPSVEERGNSRHEADEEDSLKFQWPSEDEQFEVYKTSVRRKSEETDWSWEQEET